MKIPLTRHFLPAILENAENALKITPAPQQEAGADPLGTIPELLCIFETVY